MRGSARTTALAAAVLLLAALAVPPVPPAAASHAQTEPNGDVVRFLQPSGNEWWVQVRMGGPDGPSASSVLAMDTGGPWVPLKAQTWTSDHTWWAASFHIEPGHQVRFSASFPDGVTGFESCWFSHPAGVEQCSAQPPPPPPPPPPPSSAVREAEAFAVRTAGGLQGSSSASAGAVWNLWSNGYIQDTLQGNGADTLAVVARGTPLGGVWPTMVVSVDGVVARTGPVSSSSLASYPVTVLSSGAHTVRIAFTNDALSSTEDRNLILDVARVGAGSAPPPPPPPGSGPWTLAAGQSASWTFQWPGGPGFLVADAATPPADNRHPSLRTELDGVAAWTAVVAGPVARPQAVAFDLPSGAHTARFTALGGPLTVSAAGVGASAPPTSFSGAAARVHQGGAQEGSAWRFTDFGWLDSRLVVPTTGWYELRVQGAGTVADVGPLVHLLLNRTVVAEGVQGTAVDLSTRHYLVAGVGYTLGASFENPWPGRTARFDTLSAVPSEPPPALPDAVPVDTVDDPSGWPQYGRDHYNTRSSDDPALPTVATAASMALRWRANVDGSVTGTPAVADGRVFVGTWAKSLYALDEATGAVLWRVTLPLAMDGSAAVADGKVIVGDVRTVMAFNAATGALLWTSPDFGGHTWSSPTIDGNAVFVGLGVGRGYVVRLDLATGAVVWMTPTAANVNGGARVWASPLVPPGSGLVVVGTSPGTVNEEGPTIDSLLAYDRETGALRWTHQFFPRDQNREATPEETVRENRDISGTPHLAVLGGRPVVLASEKHGPAWMVDLTDGSLVSGGRLLDTRAALIGSGGVADGVRVVSATEPDRIAAFDLATGDLLWQQPMPSTEFAPVAISNGVVWAGTYEGHLHAFDLRTGRELVRLEAGGGVLGGASLADGAVFVGALQKPAGSVNFFDSLGKTPGTVSSWRLP